MDTNTDKNLKSEERAVPTPHPPTDHNPYPYPLAQPNKKGWFRALIWLILVAVVVTIVCLVVGIYNHHEKSIGNDPAIEQVEVIP